ncbi:MAG: phospholipid/cholesterol/gamma-HCH transport system substrate-binding protein [Candidatus Omnitrophota bacterium]
MKTANESKIGLFVLIAFALFVGILWKLDVVELQQYDSIKVYFNQVDGLETGAPIQLSGVNIGEVHSISVKRDSDHVTRVEVGAKIVRGVDIGSDCQIRIGSQGLLGIKFIEVIPGNTLGAPKAGYYIGEDPVKLEDVIRTGERVAIKMETTVDAINDLIQDDEVRVMVRENVDNLSVLIIDLRSTLASINEVLDGVKNGRGLIGKLLTDEKLYADLQEITDDIKRNPWKLLKKR